MKRDEIQVGFGRHGEIGTFGIITFHDVNSSERD